MDRVNRFFELKELWKQSAEADRPAIDRQITELMNGMADQEIEELAIGVQKDFDNIHQELADSPFKEQAGCYGSGRNNQRTQSEKVKRNEECRNQCDKHTVHILLHAVTAVNVGRKGYD